MPSGDILHVLLRKLAVVVGVFASPLRDCLFRFNLILGRTSLRPQIHHDAEHGGQWHRQYEHDRREGGVSSRPLPCFDIEDTGRASIGLPLRNRSRSLANAAADW